MLDNRIGKHGEFTPTACAVSGLPVTLQGAIQVSLGNKYYALVRPSMQSRVTPELIAELQALLPSVEVNATEDEKISRKPKSG